MTTLGPETLALPEGLPRPRHSAHGERWFGLMVMRWGPSELDSARYVVDRHELHLDLAGGGRSWFSVAGGRRHLASRAHQFVTIPAGREVRWSGAVTDAVTISVDPPLLERVVAEEFDADPATFVLHSDTRAPSASVSGLVRRVADLAAGGSPPSLAAECLAREFAALLAETGPGWRRRSPAGGTLSAWQLRRLEAYVEAHLACATLEGMAAACRLSPRQLLRSFRRSFGTTPVRHILDRRLTVARAMLARDDEPIAQIAVETGFHDQAHFTNAFRRAYGTSPGRHRRGRP